MTVLSITCDNCGAKYKLPETFTGAQAKCQKCGSVIDVQKQRNAGASAAASAAPAAKPAAAARPAVDRSKSEPKPAAAAPSRPARASASKAKGDGGDDDGKARRGGRERPEKKKNSMMPLVMSGVGVVAIAIVAFVLMRGDGPKTTDTADKTGTTTEKPAEKANEKPAEPAAKAPDAPTEKPAEKPADKPTDKPAESASDPKPADATAPATPPKPADPGRPLKAWEKITGLNSLADVTKATSYPEIAWPAAIDDAKKTEIRGLCDDVKNGGRAGIRAKPKLVEIGWGALFGIVETLRTLDYTTESGNELGFELHRVLEDINAGLGSGFEQVQIGEPIDPRLAEFNTRTVLAWIKTLEKYADEGVFKKAISDRKKKQADADK